MITLYFYAFLCISYFIYSDSFLFIYMQFMCCSTRSIEKKTDHKTVFILEIVRKMRECAAHCYSGADIHDIEVLKLPEMIAELQSQMNLCGDILDEMIKEAKEVPYFPSIVSIVGIGENLAARLIAELGDLSRFKNRRALAAYAGLNPKIRQSGDVEGKHLKISKKGNRHLRCLLYLGASCNYRLKKHDEIYEFNKKKRHIQTISFEYAQIPYACFPRGSKNCNFS